MHPLFVILWPLMLALLLARRNWVPAVTPWVLPAAAVPALALALLPTPAPTVGMPWLILGTELGLGGGGPVFLLLTGLLWFAAGWYAPAYLGDDSRLRRYAFFHLLTFTGNVGLVLAEDVPGFYACFALMTFSAYGLVVHGGSPEALRAGRIYIGTAIFGEALLLAALFLAVAGSGSWRLADLHAAVADSPWRNAIIPLALAGFGVKAGALPVHFWLPLAHPVAPTPASAVLSGAMIKAGLLGWLHVLPLGTGNYGAWGAVTMLLGFLAAFYAVGCGLFQRDTKTVLAYSSISQMGLMTAGIGAALSDARLWPAAAAMLPLYAFHHGLAKGALFLGVGVGMAFRRGAPWQRALVLAGLGFASLSIAGAPLLAGATTKYALKGLINPALAALPGSEMILVVSALTTTLLLGRFVLLVAVELRSAAPRPAGRSLWLAWLLTLAGVAVGAGVALRLYAIEVDGPELTFTAVWAAAWPILGGAALLWWFQGRSGRRMTPGPVTSRSASVPLVPPGDIVVPVEAAISAWGRFHRRLPAAAQWQLNLMPLVERVAKSRAVQEFFNRVEIGLKRWETAGLALLLLLLSFWVTLR
jgi:formate hydrogenlyase subunit 3/multisubunit Na+/H+ antiporter MnhD subunit